MNILLIEDDAAIASLVCDGFAKAGHNVTHVINGKDGLERALERAADVIILDRMLPGLSGIEILETLRAKGVPTPVLILSALGDVDDRVKGLRSGGDDYLVKPFAMAELIVRVEGLGRRPVSQAVEAVLGMDDLVMDRIARTVVRAGKTIDLQTKDFALLEYLLLNPGMVITRSMMLEHVWNYHFDPQTNVIDVHISRLRRKIDDGHARPLIHTLRGKGYMMASVQP